MEILALKKAFMVLSTSCNFSDFTSVFSQLSPQAAILVPMLLWLMTPSISQFTYHFIAICVSDKSEDRREVDTSSS